MFTSFMTLDFLLSFSCLSLCVCVCVYCRTYTMLWKLAFVCHMLQISFLFCFLILFIIYLLCNGEIFKKLMVKFLDLWNLLKFKSCFERSVLLQDYYCCSVTKLCLTLCDPMSCNMPGFPVLDYLPELTQTHVHWVGDIQLSHPMLLPSVIFPP